MSVLSSQLYRLMTVQWIAWILSVGSLLPLDIGEEGRSGPSSCYHEKPTARVGALLACQVMQRWSSGGNIVNATDKGHADEAAT